MKNLQKALGINAIFSGITGIGLILFYKSIAAEFNVEQSNIFWMIGIGLIFFALTILLEVIKQRKLAVLWIIIQDFVWVIASIFLLIFRSFNISNTGNTTISIVALVVFFMAINQSKALAQTNSSKEKGKKQLVFRKIVNSNKLMVWKVISDVGNYHHVAPNIDDVTIVSGKNEGLVRSCSHGKDSWTETCSVWQEEKTYSFIVNTSAPDYPYPLSFMQGTWNVIKIDENHTEIEMIFEFTYKKKILNLLHPIMKMKFKKISNELLDNWQKIILDYGTSPT